MLEIPFWKAQLGKEGVVEDMAASTTPADLNSSGFGGPEPSRGVGQGRERKKGTWPKSVVVPQMNEMRSGYEQHRAEKHPYLKFSFADLTCIGAAVAKVPPSSFAAGQADGATVG